MDEQSVSWRDYNFGAQFDVIFFRERKLFIISINIRLWLTVSLHNAAQQRNIVIVTWADILCRRGFRREREGSSVHFCTHELVLSLSLLLLC